MIWTPKRIPQDGDYKTITKFAFFPTKVLSRKDENSIGNNVMVWLEFYKKKFIFEYKDGKPYWAHVYSYIIKEK